MNLYLILLRVIHIFAGVFRVGAAGLAGRPTAHARASRAGKANSRDPVRVCGLVLNVALLGTSGRYRMRCL
jgi:hypothetical protein